MRLHHVQVACPPGGEDVARRFYADGLGMTEVEKPADLRARGGAWFRQGAAEVHVGVEEPFSPARKAHPAFVLDDADSLDATARRLAALGYDVDDSQRTTFPGHVRVHTFDGHGNRVELLAPAPAATGEEWVPTTDLYDELGEALGVSALPWISFGGRRRFAGEVVTVRVPCDNVRVRAMLSGPGAGRVLVVDGGGVRDYALLGDQIGELAVASGWAGVVVHGCVRDRDALARLDLGVVALGTSPRKSLKHGDGEADVIVSFGGATFRPGDRVVVDEDGVVVVAGRPGS